MKKLLIALAVLCAGISGCTKAIERFIKPVIAAHTTVPAANNAFIQYLIKKGEQYSDKNPLTNASYDSLTFLVKFDSSAIYQTVLPANQPDINKLYGFSDNNAQHHQFSARYGWRWSNNALRLFAYTYNDSIRQSQELRTIDIGTTYKCQIKVAGNKYVFKMDGKELIMLRTATTSRGSGYKLYPYFGGDELAPHNINIWIAEQP